ncbi:MAG: serine/threonine-protein kinase [Myxococcota bacterium]
MHHPTAHRFGDTYVSQRVNQSAHATVYRGRRGDADVACKVYAADRSARLDERIRRECALQSSIDHPCLAPLVEWGRTESGAAYAVSPWIDGPTLRERLNAGPIPWPELRPLAADLAGALRAIHERAALHRDVKPSNVVLRRPAPPERRARAVLLDLGHALLSDETRLTATGMTVGTPAYMAPEQATGQPVDARADLYSLGVVLYEALTGQRPFIGTTLAEIVEQCQTQPIERPSLRGADVPRSVEDLVLWLLEKDPQRRAPSTHVLIHALASTSA